MYHLAQANLAKLKAPIDSPTLAPMVARLEEINMLAERSPGFVWRLKGENGSDALDYRPVDDPMVVLNMSTWESVKALYQYTYYSDHVEVFRQRRDWFEKVDWAYQALWWVPAGHHPTVEEAVARIEHVREHGPTPHAFTFKQRFDPR